MIIITKIPPIFVVGDFYAYIKDKEMVTQTVSKLLRFHLCSRDLNAGFLPLAPLWSNKGTR
jgi:hypothetical protein